MAEINAKNPIRIAMWSGPRNISTAMMRSWDARADCVVSDEPLYAHYLSTLGESKRAEHPVYQQVIESQETDAKKLASMLTGPIPDNKPIWYQKHMAHHLTADVDLDWIGNLTNAFLIRDPARMIASFDKVIPNPSPLDLGLPQQLKLFEWVRGETGSIPAVIDSDTVLQDPSGMLNTLCEYLGVPFDDSMLSWDAGPRESDGVWAPAWYDRVYKSTGFSNPNSEPIELPKRLHGVLNECVDLSKQLNKFALASFTEGWVDRIRKGQLLSHIQLSDMSMLSRVRYGSENEDWGAETQRCRDCGAAHDEFHVVGCDVERCPQCHGQSISCACEVVGPINAN